MARRSRETLLAVEQYCDILAVDGVGVWWV